MEEIEKFSWEEVRNARAIMLEDVQHILREFLGDMPRFKWGTSISRFAEKWEKFEQKWL
jgi:hypothetical protein